MSRMRRSYVWLVCGLFVIALGGACAGDSGSGSTGGGDGARGSHAAQPAPGAQRAQDEAVTGAAFDSEQGGSGAALGAIPPGSGTVNRFGDTPSIGPSVIKTAEVELEIPKDGFQGALQEAVAAAGRFGGFVLSTSVEGKGASSGSVVLRVPAEEFEAALAHLEDLGKVTRETVSGKDVGQEFVDLEARIRNLDAQEVVLLRLMGRAQTVVATIRVQRELQKVQLEIERLEGRLRFLRDQAEMSTISLSMMEAGAAPKGPPKVGVLAKAWDRALNAALAVVSGVIVATGAVVPVAILLALLYLLVRMVRPRVISRWEAPEHTG